MYLCNRFNFLDNVNMKKTRMKKAVLLLILFGVTLTGWSENEWTDTELTDTSRVFNIEEVVVVSQPKETFWLRQQPLSSSSFSGSDIAQQGIQDLRGLSAYIPSFTMPEYGSRVTSSMYVRGIGSRVNSPALTIYVDGVPLQNKSGFNFHTYGIDRVDVLRGPQGTLYGQNTEGGLIRMYTKNPFHHKGTDVTLSVGNHFWRKAEVEHFHQFGEKTALSVAAFYDGQNGFIKNQYSGKYADKMNEAGGRFNLQYRPSKTIRMGLLADYQYVNQNGFPYGLLNVKSQKADNPNTDRLGTYRRNMLTTAFSLGWQAPSFELNSVTSYQFLHDNMAMDIDYSPLNAMLLEQRQHKNGFTEEITLKSTRPSRWHWTTGAFASIEWLRTDAPIHFYDESFTHTIATSVRNAMYTAMQRSMAASMAERGMPMEQAMAAAASAIERAGGVSMDVTLDIPGVFRTPTYNFALFHESNFEITDRLIATLGLRYDYTQVRIGFDTKAEMDFIASVMGTDATYHFTSHLERKYHDTYHQLLPKFGLTYKLDNAGSNVYATVSKGFRAGGYNIQTFGDYLRAELEIPEYRNQAMRGDFDIPHDADSYALIEKSISYKPEESWNYEAGTHLNLFDNKLLFDFSAYYMQIRNQQLSLMAGNYGFGRIMVNAGKSYSCGIETSLRGSLLDNRLSYSISYGYTHAAFKRFVDEVTAEDGSKTTVDYKDKHVPFVPEHTMSVCLDYRIDIDNPVLRSIIVGANTTGQGRTYWDEANYAKENFYALLGAHVDANLKLANTDCILSLWGKNITKTRYNTFGFAYQEPGGTYFAQRGNPVQIGADLKFSF